MAGLILGAMVLVAYMAFSTADDIDLTTGLASPGPQKKPAKATREKAVYAYQAVRKCYFKTISLDKCNSQVELKPYAGKLAFTTGPSTKARVSITTVFSSAEAQIGLAVMGRDGTCALITGGMGLAGIQSGATTNPAACTGAYATAVRGALWLVPRWVK
jgi:hypothetical protein